MNAEGERSVGRQFAIPMGLMFGFLVAAVLCLGYAWLHRNPVMPLHSDRDDIAAMLWRTTVVVAISAALVVGCVVVGRLHYRSNDRRKRFLTCASPALAILAVSGVLALGRGRTRDVFDGAAEAQQALVPFEITTVARWAWWCACLAVLMIALTAVAGIVSVDDRTVAEPSALATNPVAAGVVALVVVIVVAVSAFATEGTSSAAHIADRIDAPQTPGITGDVAYRIAYDKYDSAEFVPAGSGFVRGIERESGTRTPGRIEGYDGATGQRRWTFSQDGLDPGTVGSTGVGPDSVVVAQSFDGLFGLDATTGTPLWARPGVALPDGKIPDTGLSATVVLAGQPDSQPPGRTAAGKGTRWEALSPRTGEVMWTRTFGYYCEPRTRVTDAAVIVRSCEDDPDVIARILDPATGEERSVIRASALGVNAAGPEFDWNTITVDNAMAGFVNLTVNDISVIMDVQTGDVVYRAPEGHHATLIDGASLELTGPQPAIVEIPSGTLIPTEVTSAPRREEDTSFSSWAHVGSQWLTMLPEGPLWAIDAAGTVRKFPNPCNTHKGARGVAAVPGALIVNCDQEFAGVR